ncbi:hypothetical protein ACFFJ7_18875 [Pseudochelatococcus lubricantis]|uniref:hypothetical protein n=1 Tax=Pseudochelatococcus lubricantis TaxID=1538102 RepID=UPI0035EAB1BC
MAAGDPAWPRVEAILRPHLQNGRTALSVWPVAGETAHERAQDLIAAFQALFGMVWGDMVDSVLILGNDGLFPKGLDLFLDNDVRKSLFSIPAPLLIAGPAQEAPDFGASGWEGLRTPVAMAQAIAATVAQYPTILEAAYGKNKP